VLDAVKRTHGCAASLVGRGASGNIGFNPETTHRQPPILEEPTRAAPKLNCHAKTISEIWLDSGALRCRRPPDS
jgi:hypothetical protein